MAYASNQNPGFAASGVSPQQYIANVIQGESSTPAGQFAVASVIQNRTDASFGGFGDNVLQTTSQPLQFDGYQNAAPGSNAYNLAGQLINGTLSQSGDTGNALYYANPTVPGVSSWTKGLYNGGYAAGDGNIFSNNLGAPSSGFVPPTYGGSTPTAVASNADQLQDQAQDAGDYSTQSNYTASASGNQFPSAGFDGSGFGGSAAGVNSQYALDQGAYGAQAPADAMSPDYTFAQAGLASAPGATSAPGIVNGDPANASSYAGNSFQNSVSYSTPQTPDSGSSDATAAGSMTVPMAIDAQTRGASQDTTAQDKAISSAADSTNKTNQADTKAVTGTLSGIASLFDASGKNIFIRFAIITLGLVVLAFALYSLAKDHDLLPKRAPALIPV